MTILFTANLSEKHQKRLLNNFPKQDFIFKSENTNLDDHLAEASVIVTYGGDLDNEMIEQARNLKWIMVLSAGMEQMPLQAINERHIRVTNVRGIHKVPMAEYALSMLLHVYRQEKTITENNTEKKWDPSVRVQEITGRTMLVVGAGAIGQEVARLAQAFQMKTVGISRSGTAVGHFDENYKVNQLDDVLPQADFIVSVLPSTSETKNTFALKQFKLMKDTAVFLNMGRGDAVVEADLLQAIKQEEIVHAILDVFIDEPLAEDHPFWKEKNVTVTPHISAQSANYVPRALDIFEENLNVYLKDEEGYINSVDCSRGY